MTATTADIVLGSTTVRQIVSTSHRSGLVTVQDAGGGAAVIQQVSGVIGEEVSSFVSEDVKGLMAIGTNTFISAGSYVASGTVTIPFQERSNGGIFASGSNHNALGGTDALCVPTSIEASQDEEQAARVNCDVHWISSDGTTKGCTGSTGNALASQSFNESFSLGKVSVNGTALTGVQSIRINPGIEIIKSRGDGGIYPVIVSIRRVAPTMEITTNDMSDVTLVSDWTAMSAAIAYLRKRDDSGDYEADDDVGNPHLSFTFGAGVQSADCEVSSNGNGTVTIMLTGKALTHSNGTQIP